ncbi:hypothetical protein ACFO5X_13515 [Seohaeicola nanhaiensis]|uniref:Uncharacterized protein n=1 Tax=Seohaeicola nanhaiensis TaxID=1387282 RepID=A0ABV9KHZ4_9RHOB
MTRPQHAIGMLATAAIAAAATLSLAMPTDDFGLPSRSLAGTGVIPEGAILVFDDNGLLEEVRTDQQTAQIQADNTPLHPLTD